MKKESAIKDLKTVKQVFDKFKVPFFLAYGTALGAVRDKDFLPGDNDIDLGVIEPLTLKQRKEIGWTLYNLGFKPQQVAFEVFDWWEVNEPGYMGTEKTGVIVAGREVEITIFFYFDDGKKKVCIPRLGALPIMESPNRFYRKFDKVKFYGETFLVPSPVEEYLEWTYEDWKDSSKRDAAKLWTQLHPKK